MKVAEALIERAALTKRLTEVRGRLTGNLVVDEDEEAQEDISALWEQAGQMIERIEVLTVAINRTNMVAKVDLAGYQGSTIMEMVAYRDRLDRQIGLIREMLQQVAPDPVSGRGRRYSYEARTKDTIRQKPVIVAADWRKKHDRYAELRGKVDLALQAANWSAELVEDAGGR